MAIAALDRLLTIVVTATLTSAVWIVAGGSLMQQASTMGAGVTASPRGKPLPMKAVARKGDSVIQAGETGAPVRAPGGRLVLPVTGVRSTELVDTFTAARAGGARVHDAIDIMAPLGRPVVAAAPGTIEKLFLSKAGGKTVYVRSDDRRTIYYYAHLDQYDPRLAENRRIERGAPIGTVGYTGNASPSGPHLHFAIMQTTPQAKWWEPASAINPYPLLTGK